MPVLNERYLQYRLPANLTERAHLEQMADGIREVVEEGFPHGDFVTAIAHREFDKAFLCADETNERFIQALFDYRLRSSLPWRYKGEK